MTADEEKIKVLEKGIETDYPGQSMSHEAFLLKIERAEEAACKGEVTDHEQIKGITAAWSHK